MTHNPSISSAVRSLEESDSFVPSPNSAVYLLQLGHSSSGGSGSWLRSGAVSNEEGSDSGAGNDGCNGDGCGPGRRGGGRPVRATAASIAPKGVAAVTIVSAAAVARGRSGTGNRVINTARSGAFTRADPRPIIIIAPMTVPAVNSAKTGTVRGRCRERVRPTARQAPGASESVGRR